MGKQLTQTCGACGGRGTLPTREVGQHLRAKREKVGVSIADMGGAMGLSPTYLGDLERGNRNWTNELVESYEAKLTELVEGQPA